MAVEQQHDDTQLILMVGLTFLAAMLSGSTLEWVYERGIFSKSFRDPKNTYNIIVFVAAIFSSIQAFSNFWLYYFQPSDVTWFLFWCLGTWIIMTHTSVMLVSNRLSMLYRNPHQVWKRLLLINAAMAPVSLLVLCSWGGNQISGGDPIFAKMNRIIEPTQIALWGIIEFVLSGMFIVKMWKFQWTSVERWSMFVLVLVGLCDLSTVFANILVGDLESTVVKAFVYNLRIRLEVNVLCVLVDFLEKKNKSPSKRISGLDVTPSVIEKAMTAGKMSYTALGNSSQATTQPPSQSMDFKYNNSNNSNTTTNSTRAGRCESNVEYPLLEEDEDKLSQQTMDIESGTA